MSAQKDGKLVTIVIKSSIHSLGRGNAHCCNLSQTYTAGRKFCIHVHVFCGPFILLQNFPHVTHWIQYCIITSETVKRFFDYWSLNVIERAKIRVFLCLVLITFASIRLLTKERFCSFLGKKQWVSKALYFIHLVCNWFCNGHEVASTFWYKYYSLTICSFSVQDITYSVTVYGCYKN